ncbi:MAG: hypothetical protein ABIR37_04375 [Candidatus Saccharimonadales bacterium]
MKLLSRIFNNLPKRLAAAAIVALAISLPAIGLAADTVKIEGAFGVANVTAGDTTYKSAVNATYDQVVKYEVYYHNQEQPDSGKVAQNLNVKIALPSAAGKVQTATATIKADNSNTISKTATVNLDRADAYLQFIPGSAVWKHNVGTNDNVNVQETKISDAVVNSGLTLENEKPCYNFAATVTVLARVMVPGVKVTKQVEKATESNKWAKTNTAAPGETLKYKIGYENAGNVKQNAVVVSDNLPPNMSVVPGTTHVYNPSDVLDKTNNIASGGLDLGNYTPGAGFVVTFEAKLPTADKLACGDTVFRNVGVVQPQGMQQYFDTATTTVTKVCTPENPKTPVYSCDKFNFTVENKTRTITVSEFKTTQTNGATFKNVVIDWGDSTTPLTTTAAVDKTHKFEKDGTYTVVATAHFTVDGKDVTSAGANCSKSVTFTTTPTTTTTTTPTTPEVLANTGPGEVFGMFAAVTAAGAIAHRLFLARRLTQ